MNSKMLETQINKIIAHNEGISVDKVSSTLWLQQWAKSKERFIKAFKGMIYEVPKEISFRINAKAQNERIFSLCDNIQYIWNNAALADFVFQQRTGFMENTVVSDFMAPDGTKIQSGAKLLRAFKYFEKDKDALQQIQDAASMIIQEGKVSGRLCVSVHPLDFLSSSENTYHWRSCHSLDGDYRAGNISYMLDDCTVMIYLRGEESAKLPNFPEDVPWNSKKWRMLLHVSKTNNEFFAGRQYPFKIDTALDTVKDLILPLISKMAGDDYPHYMPWNDFYMTKAMVYGTEENYHMENLTDQYLVIHHDIFGLNEIVKNGEDSCAFNDILMSSCYTPYYTYTTKAGMYEGFKAPTSFVIGAAARCPCCGERNITDKGTFLCDACHRDMFLEDGDAVYCENCGARVWSEAYGAESMATLVEGDILCDACRDLYTGRCSCCSGLFYNEHLNYNRKVQSFLCFDCNFEEDEENG